MNVKHHLMLSRSSFGFYSYKPIRGGSNNSPKRVNTIIYIKIREFNFGYFKFL